ncbi:MAG: serine/threonine protein phosphatase, partial [Candidatus Korarchaeota archaeon NZ13-K]
NVVFLGDYVDRGAKQIENLNFLLANHMRDERVVLLRGNHESPVVNMNYGFMEALYHTYGSEWPYIYVRYNEVLSNLPYAALVDGILALHGGIAEGLRTLRQIESLPKKDMIPSNRIAFQILWNDPSEEVDGFGENLSRGGGVKYYGKAALEGFLRENRLKLIVRSHEAYPDGYAMLFEGETGIEGLRHRLISVFSCSYYGIAPTAAVYDGRRVEVLRI